MRIARVLASPSQYHNPLRYDWYTVSGWLYSTLRNDLPLPGAFSTNHIVFLP
jgi:hypothetical protein